MSDQLSDSNTEKRVWTGRQKAMISIVVAGLALTAIVMWVAAGPPYADISCSEDDWAYTPVGGQLDDPDSLCEDRQDAIHPFVFDLRVSINHQLGMHEYTTDHGTPLNDSVKPISEVKNGSE